LAQSLSSSGINMPIHECVAALTLSLLLFSTPSMAGVEKESRITQPGLFFAWLPPADEPVLVISENKAHLLALTQHCNTGQEVYRLRTGRKYKCKFELYKDSGEMDRRYAIATVQGPPVQADDRAYGLFSVTPPRTVDWIARKADSTELEALEALLAADSKRFAPVRNDMKLKRAATVSRQDSTNAVVFIPGKVEKDREGLYYEKKHHVFLKRGSAYSYLGELPGAPSGYVDIDGSDLPGIVATVGCDGLCVSLWSVNPELRSIGDFGGH
jgi:hypothetical protein